jgi:cytochrome c-type biogenesis protein CcmH/NrfG
MLGSTYILKGEPEKGLVEYEKAYRLNPKSRPVVMDLIEIYRVLNMLGKGRSLLADWVSRNPNDSDAARQLRQWSVEERGG